MDQNHVPGEFFKAETAGIVCVNLVEGMLEHLPGLLGARFTRRLNASILKFRFFWVLIGSGEATTGLRNRRRKRGFN